MAHRRRDTRHAGRLGAVASRSARVPSWRSDPQRRAADAAAPAPSAVHERAARRAVPAGHRVEARDDDRRKPASIGRRAADRRSARTCRGRATRLPNASRRELDCGGAACERLRRQRGDAPTIRRAAGVSGPTGSGACAGIHRGVAIDRCRLRPEAVTETERRSALLRADGRRLCARPANPRAHRRDARRADSFAHRPRRRVRQPGRAAGRRVVEQLRIGEERDQGRRDRRRRHGGVREVGE